MQQTQSLYEKLGGEEAISKVVDYFYKLVLSDDAVNHFFEHTDMKQQREHQKKFLSFALGGPHQYTGQSMEKAHEGMNIQPVHFEAIVNHLCKSLEHFNVGEDDIDQVLSKVESLRVDIMYK